MADLIPIKQADPFAFPESHKPLGLKYQWVPYSICGEHNPQMDALLDAGWMRVPRQWHAPFPVEVGKCWLLCHARPVDEELQRIEGANRNIEEWSKRVGGAGISGGFRIISGEQQKTALVGDERLARRVVEYSPMAPALPPVKSAPVTVTHKLTLWGLLKWYLNLTRKGR